MIDNRCCSGSLIPKGEKIDLESSVSYSYTDNLDIYIECCKYNYIISVSGCTVKSILLLYTF